MKEFGNTLRQTFRINYKEIFSYAGISAAGALLGMVFILIGMVTVGKSEGSYANVGAILSLMFGEAMFLFGGIFSVQYDFNLAVSMGKARRYFVPARYLCMVLNGLIILGIVKLVNFLERALYPVLYPGAVCGMDIDWILGRPAVFIGFVLGLPSLILLLGALIMKFSTKFYWGIWAFWMLGFMGIPRLLSAGKKHPDSLAGKAGNLLMDLAGGVTGTGLMAALLCGTGAGILIALLILKKQRVTL